MMNQRLSEIRSLYRGVLHDLGSGGNPLLEGIHSPVYDARLVDHYIHEQFQGGAAAYAERYAATDYFRWLLERAFAAIGWGATERTGLRVLDIGSGSGNSIFPLLELCPDSVITATDLSVELLALLRQALVSRKQAERCFLLQLNVEELDFEPESFDLAVGAAILHHLFDPAKAVAGCARVLRPGGYAVFFEPFEHGFAVLRLAYQAILADSRSRSLPPDARRLLEGLCTEFAHRMGRDKTDPIYAQLDDKWLFTTRHLRELAAASGFAACEFVPLHPAERAFERQTETNLRLGISRGRDALPDWAWDTLQGYDEAFSADGKADLMLEAAILLRR